MNATDVYISFNMSCSWISSGLARREVWWWHSGGCKQIRGEDAIRIPGAVVHMSFAAENQVWTNILARRHQWIMNIHQLFGINLHWTLLCINDRCIKVWHLYSCGLRNLAHFDYPCTDRLVRFDEPARVVLRPSPKIWFHPSMNATQ